MDKWMTPEINRILPFLGIGIISFSVIIALLARKIRSSFKPFSRKAIIYLLAALLLFGLTALVIAAGIFKTYTGYFIFFQILFVLYGSLHVYLMKKKMAWGQDERSFWPDVLYSFLIMVAGALVFALVYRLVNREGLEWPMMASVVFFIVPVFVTHTFRKAMEIPPKVLKQWYYPVHQPVEDPDENKLKNLLLISFEFQKKSDDAWFTNFRAKAPTDMELGRLFYYFINDYNERHPQARIHYINANGEPYGWMFYKKPRWYTILTGYMDADKTIFVNSIRENDIIVCARIF
jgi:hypothetical protein